MKLVSELHDFISVGIVFHRDAPENEKLVLKRSILLVWAELRIKRERGRKNKM